MFEEALRNNNIRLEPGTRHTVHRDQDSLERAIVQPELSCVPNPASGAKLDSPAQQAARRSSLVAYVNRNAGPDTDLDR